MGAKISVDSATLMNKSLELIEAYNIFNFSFDKYKVLIQPEGMIHGIVNMKDGSSFAHMYNADMKIPISMCCFIRIATYIDLLTLTFLNSNKLILKNHVMKSSHLLNLHMIIKEGMSAQIALNASNEIAVDLVFK